MPQTVFATCSLCEATCGLRFEVEDNRVLSVRPDDDDVFSRGYACPKGIAIADIHHDPDRLRRPVRRNAAGRFEEISWETALDLVASRLGDIRAQHGANAIGFYWGNPTGNNHGALLMLSSFTKALGTRNRFSSGSQDANPRLVASYELYGSSISIPIPDIDRTDYFLCLGGNPMVSNGSVMTAPDMRRRLRAVRERGGTVVVVDPRRTETAKEADEHVAIRPGGDAALLLAMVEVLAERRLVDRALLEHTTTGWADIERRLAAFTPARVADFTGVPASTIERLALEFAAARSAVCYSRVGVCVGHHATLATLATDLLNIVTGRLGREGGPMFTTPAFDVSGLARMGGLDGRDRWRSRVRGLPETVGDIPSTVMADEIETAGDGQIRAMVTFAGNPVLSAPNGRRIAAAFEKLDFMVSIDIYINETTRHADVILPPCWNLAEDHIDMLFSSVAVRNFARWSPPVVERERGEMADWEILLALTERLGGGPLGQPWVDRILRWLRPLGVRWTPTGFLDLVLRLGPYGDRFLPWSKGLSLEKLRSAPHGIDLGPLKPGIERRMYHGDGRIHLASRCMLDAIAELERDLDAKRTQNGLVLIGRRELRSNNSWMHNVPALVSGRERCTLYVHPDDAARCEVRHGEPAILESRVHRGEVLVEVTDDMRPGVVSLPHGWGHADSAPWQSVAGRHAGVSANDWVDDGVVEPIIGQSILNGVPVRLAPLRSATPPPSEKLSSLPSSLGSCEGGPRVSPSAPMSHPTTRSLLRPFAMAIAALPLLGSHSQAAKVTCPNGRYVIVTGGDLIATTDGVPPTIDLVDRTVTILDGCEIRRGRVKPTKQGVRVSGKFRDCGGVPKLKLKLLIPATCDTVSGAIRGRGVTPATVAGALSLCGNGVLDQSPAEDCDPGVPGVPCQNAGACSPTCRCGGTGGATTTTLPPGGTVTVNVVDAFCTKTACTCDALVGVDYHLQATGTASGPVGTELRVNVSALQGGQLDCGGWTPIDASVNPACTAIKCCRRETGQPETSNWAATEAIDLPCYCPSASPTPYHNYLGQAQLPPGGFPVESEKTTTACP